ncbi:hypothetical protein Nepgr_031545 [Nepenthes gracilis]|uniref:Geranylgeranyl transferase type-2 subunit alpha n=1 Tax=Nepenthes gracilis TaxID=150966 RepID=A0AAD3TJ28_NEPGR|nr:hypothetical protein Nepgr_031545 [Nepenthes gracilis]
MHGRPRKSPKPENEAASLAKAAKLRTLQSQCLHNHEHHIYDEEAMEVSANLLEINPEFYTAWNYRKLAVDHNLSLLEPDSDSVHSILNEELRVVEIALRQNYKSYGAWHHRKWVLSKGHLSLDHELRLLDRFQKADSRNFHAWGYRRFIATQKNIPEVEELKYTTNMIERNFSNYSAWHNRSIILSTLLKRKADGFSPKEKILSQEYELVQQAIFTDPDDQSGWFYYLWLLDQTINVDAPMLISSWPAPGSELIIPVNGSAAGSMVSPFGSFHIHEGTIPLVLYFNQVVKGVNSSTVTVRSLFTENRSLSWRPLSTSESNGAQAWVAYLNISDVKIDSSKIYHVEVILEHFKDIISLSGFHLSYAFVFKYAIHIQDLDLRLSKGQDIEVISWKYDSFQKYEADFWESNPIPSFDQATIDKEQKAIDSKWCVDTVANEVALFRDLLSFTNCKIAKLMLARLLTALDAKMSDRISNSYQLAHCEEVQGLYSDLIELDPPHLQYYKDQRSLALLHQITSSRETLLRCCWCYRDSAPSDGRRFICLRLDNLSITQIGSIQRLLWVQMLDLSHNELRSINGLEAMQLLSCLNLSYNKLRSFTALDPLRHLNLLRVLDISHNEIGEHSVDATRYLCSSPLSHTVGSDQKSDKFPIDMVMKYWEAFYAFEDLDLIQLDVAGNTIVDEDFKLFLCKLLPRLTWLDGSSIN